MEKTSQKKKYSVVVTCPCGYRKFETIESTSPPKKGRKVNARCPECGKGFEVLKIYSVLKEKKDG